jgi:hypothetical protein
MVLFCRGIVIQILRISRKAAFSPSAETGFLGEISPLFQEIDG